MNILEYAKFTKLVKAESGGETDALSDFIDGSMTELVSNVRAIKKYAFEQERYLISATFPEAETVGEYAFERTENLKTVDLPKATQLGMYCFQYSSVENLNVPCVNKIGHNAIKSSKLKTLKLPSYVTSNTSYEMSGAYSSLVFVSLPIVKTLGSYAFSDNRILVTVLVGVERDTVCVADISLFTGCYHILGTTNNTYNPTGAKDGYIYVPNALVASYRTATNWSQYATQIMPYVANLTELADIDTATYDKAYVGETEKEYTFNGTEWEEYTR